MHARKHCADAVYRIAFNQAMSDVLTGRARLGTMTVTSRVAQVPRLVKTAYAYDGLCSGLPPVRIGTTEQRNRDTGARVYARNRPVKSITIRIMSMIPPIPIPPAGPKA